MFQIASIVEGHGETEAVPGLLRRMVPVVAPGLPFEIRKPIRVRRNRLLKAGELENAVELAARQVSQSDWILILVDADEDCPAVLAPILLSRARAQRSNRRISVVVAKAEFEAWFLAAAESLSGQRRLAADIAAPPEPESIADPKRWLTHHGPAGWSYSETLDQPALASIVDLDMARRAPSFDKLWRELSAAVDFHRRATAGSLADG